jgi:hypothetical protein
MQSIGFDMDQCLVEAFNLVPFILFFEINLKGIDQKNQILIKKSRDIFYELVASSEASSPHIFRPSLLKLFPSLIKLKREGKIKHMFIYSNNGYLQILNAIDHILALILKKSPYSVNEADLNKEEDGRLHVLTPRIYIDSPCRVDTEPKIVNFREKSLLGIQTCLNDQVQANELWFVDDSLQHLDLKNKLGSQYINVEAYKIHVSNKTLVEFFIRALPKEVFIKGTTLYSTIIPIINKIFIFDQPLFYPTGKESLERLIQTFHEVMSKNMVFKPETTSRKWTTKKIETDYNVVKKLIGLNPVVAPSATQKIIQRQTYNNRTPFEERPFYGGSELPVSSRSSNRGKLRTRRKNRK